MLAIFALPLCMTGCDGPHSPATLLQQCLGITEPFAFANLGVPLAVFTTGLAANGHLAWRRTGAVSWTARWAWTDADTGEHHRTTFAIAELAQDAATTGCGPRIAAISRMTMNGDDLSPMMRDQLVYAMRDRYAADRRVKLGQAKPLPPVPAPSRACGKRRTDGKRRSRPHATRRRRTKRRRRTPSWRSSGAKAHPPCRTLKSRTRLRTVTRTLRATRPTSDSRPAAYTAVRGQPLGSEGSTREARRFSH